MFWTNANGYELTGRYIECKVRGVRADCEPETRDLKLDSEAEPTSQRCLYTMNPRLGS